MNRILFVFALFLTIGASAQQPNPSRQERQPLTRAEPERAAKAQELLKQARAALGQSAKMEDIKTLSVDGKLRRLTFTASDSPNNFVSISGAGMDIDPTILGASNQKEHFLNGKAQYDFSLPEKFRWEEEIGPQQRTGYFDGDRFGLRSNGRPAVMPLHAQYAAMMQQRFLSDYAPIVLGLLLTSLPAFPLEYNYNGEKSFQQTVAEVLTITGPGTFKADLYLDQKTHLPLLLRFVVGAMGRPAMVMMPHGTSREEGMRALEIAKQQAAAKPPDQQEREKLMFFADYRAVDGVLFPHKITTQINGKLIEEIVFSKFKLNPPINPENFSEKK